MIPDGTSMRRASTTASATGSTTASATGSTTACANGSTTASATGSWKGTLEKGPTCNSLKSEWVKARQEARRKRACPGADGNANTAEPRGKEQRGKRVRQSLKVSITSLTPESTI